MALAVVTSNLMIKYKTTYVLWMQLRTVSKLQRLLEQTTTQVCFVFESIEPNIKQKTFFHFQVFQLKRATLLDFEEWHGKQVVG